jgi:lactoylglutathione lyase
VLRSRDIPEEKYTNAFLGYGSERKGEHFALELTYNYGVDSYDMGDVRFAAIVVREFTVSYRLS